MNFSKKCIIGCVHLLPTVGAALYNNNREEIYTKALYEASILVENGVDALIIENFRDRPHFPGRVPVTTVATMAAVAREIKNRVKVPIGIAVLRNDASAAMGIAAAIGADFIRVNVHVGNALSAQGFLEGESYNTLRMKNNLNAQVEIFADAMVKHAQPLTYTKLEDEIYDLNEICNGIIVSGTLTGIETNQDDVVLAKSRSKLPIIIGSGITEDNIEKVFSIADGFIVGSYFKEDGIANNSIDPHRVKSFMKKVNYLRTQFNYD